MQYSTSQNSYIPSFVQEQKENPAELYQIELL